jgi:hypothetical protein
MQDSGSEQGFTVAVVRGMHTQIEDLVWYKDLLTAFVAVLLVLVAFLYIRVQRLSCVRRQLATKHD